MDAYTFQSVEAVNGYKGTIFTTSCGKYRFTIDSSYYDLRTGESGDLAVTYANTAFNDALSLYFSDDGQAFDNFDCGGMACSDGVIVVKDTCEGYQCSPYCDPAYVKPVFIQEDASVTYST